MLLWPAAAHAAAASADLSIEVSVGDSSNQPVPGVLVELTTGQAAVSSAVTRHAEASKANPPEDTVQLSSTAKAAMGDVDHDGDSH